MEDLRGGRCNMYESAIGANHVETVVSYVKGKYHTLRLRFVGCGHSVGTESVSLT